MVSIYWVSALPGVEKVFAIGLCEGDAGVNIRLLSRASLGAAWFANRGVWLSILISTGGAGTIGACLACSL